MDPDAQAREERRERLARIRQLNAAATQHPQQQLQTRADGSLPKRLPLPSLDSGLTFSSTAPATRDAVIAEDPQRGRASATTSIVSDESAARIQVMYEAFRLRNSLINESYVALQVERSTERLVREHRKQLTTLTFQLKVTKPLEIRNLHHRLTELREANRAMSVELETLRRARSASTERAIERNSSQAAAHSGAEDARRELEDALQQLETASHEVAVLQSEVREAREEAHRSEARIANLEDRVAKAEQRAARAEAAKASADIINADLSKQVSERRLQTDTSLLVDEQAKTIAQMTTKCESLQAQLRIAEQAQVTASIAAQNKLHDEQLRGQELSALIEAAQRDTKISEAKLKEMTLRLQNLDSQYNMLAEAKRDLERAHTEAVSKLNDLASKEATESQLLGSSQARRLELSGSVAQLTEELERDRSSAKIIAAELASLKESLRWCEDSNSDLHSKLIASEERNRTLSKSLHGERARIAQLELEARDAQDALSADVSHHQTTLKKSLVQKASLQNEIAALGAKLSEAQTEVRRLQEQNAHMSEHHRSREAEMKLHQDMLEQQLVIARKESASLQEMMREQSKQFSAERSEILSQSQRDAKEYATNLMRHDAELRDILAKQQERFDFKGQQLLDANKALDAAHMDLQRKELEFTRMIRDRDEELAAERGKLTDLISQRAQLEARIAELEEQTKSFEATRTQDRVKSGSFQSETERRLMEITGRCRALEEDMQSMGAELEHKDALLSEGILSVERERNEHLITKRLHAEDIARLRQEHAEDIAAEKAVRLRVEEQLKASEKALRDALISNSDLSLEFQRVAHEADIRLKDLAETQRMLENSKTLVKAQVGQLSEVIERSDGIVLSMNEEISSLKVELATKDVEICKLREHAGQRTDRAVSSLQQEIEEYKSAIVVMEGRQARELERQKTIMVSREQELSAVIETLKGRITSLDHSLAQKAEQVRALQEASHRCEQELTEMVSQIDSAEAAAARERQTCDAMQLDLERRTRQEQELLEKIEVKDRQLREGAAAQKAVEFECRHLEEQLANQRQEHLAAIEAVQVRLDHVQSLFGSKLSTAVDSGARKINAAFDLVQDLVVEMEIVSRRSLEESRAALDAGVRQAIAFANYFVSNVGRFRDTESSLSQQVSELTKQKKNIRLVSSHITNSLLLQIEYSDTHMDLCFNLVMTQRQEQLLRHKALCQRTLFLESELQAVHKRRVTAEFELLKSQESLTVTQQQLLSAEMELVALKRDSSSLASLAKTNAQRSSETEACLTRATTEVAFFRQLVPSLTEKGISSLFEHETLSRGMLTQCFQGLVAEAEAAFQRIFVFSSRETVHTQQLTDQLRSTAHQAIHEHSTALQFERERAAKEVYILRCVNQLQSIALVESKERSELRTTENDAFCVHLLPSWFSEMRHLLEYGHTKETQAVLHALHVSQKETVLLRSKANFLADLEATAFASSIDRLHRRRDEDRRFICASNGALAALQQDMCTVALDAVVDLEQGARLTITKMALETLHSIYLLTLAARTTQRRT
jgi:chromosome segregation ATPase